MAPALSDNDDVSASVDVAVSADASTDCHEAKRLNKEQMPTSRQMPGSLQDSVTDTTLLTQVYQVLSSSLPKQPSQLAEDLKVDIGQVHEALQTLNYGGYARPTPHNAAVWESQDTARAHEVRIGRLKDYLEEIDAHLNAAVKLTPLLAPANSPANLLTEEAQGVYTLLGNDAILAQLQQECHTAQSSLDSMVTSTPAQEVLSASLVIDLPTMQRGIAARLLYPRSAQGKQHVLDYAHALQDFKLQFRTCIDVPLRLIIVDRAKAMIISSASDNHTGEPLGIFVTEPVLVKSMLALFDALWADSQDIFQLDSPGISKQEIMVIELMRQGFTDEAIAQRIHRDVSTVRRNIKNLSSRLGVDNRFALGVEVARKGWIEGSGLTN